MRGNPFIVLISKEPETSSLVLINKEPKTSSVVLISLLTITGVMFLVFLSWVYPLWRICAYTFGIHLGNVHPKCLRWLLEGVGRCHLLNTSLEWHEKATEKGNRLKTAARELEREYPLQEQQKQWTKPKGKFVLFWMKDVKVKEHFTYDFTPKLARRRVMGRKPQGWEIIAKPFATACKMTQSLLESSSAVISTDS